MLSIRITSRYYDFNHVTVPYHGVDHIRIDIIEVTCCILLFTLNYSKNEDLHSSTDSTSKTSLLSFGSSTLSKETTPLLGSPGQSPPAVDIATGGSRIQIQSEERKLKDFQLIKVPQSAVNSPPLSILMIIAAMISRHDLV